MKNEQEIKRHSFEGTFAVNPLKATGSLPASPGDAWLRGCVFRQLEGDSRRARSPAPQAAVRLAISALFASDMVRILASRGERGRFPPAEALR